MVDALSLVGLSFRELWDEFGFLAVLDALWSLFAILAVLPWFVMSGVPWLAVLGASLLLALPLAVISGALCFVTNQITRGIAVGWSTFGTGLRRYWKKSLGVAAINLVVVTLIGINLRFYAVVLQGGWTRWALAVWLVVAAYWLIAQIFWFPMILELQSEKVLLALRNALALVLITPGFTLSIAVVMAVVAALCVLLTVPAVLLLASLALLVANHATRSRLAHVQKKPYRPGEPTTS